MNLALFLYEPEAHQIIPQSVYPYNLILQKTGEDICVELADMQHVVFSCEISLNQLDRRETGQFDWGGRRAYILNVVKFRML